MPRSLEFALVSLVAAAIACGKAEPDTGRALTQREKDSVFAHSRIPGASAVNKALVTADSASARQARLDSADRAP